MSTVEQPNGTLCPHYRDIDEELLSKLSSKVAKVRSENKELFEFTHRRIKVFDALAEEEVTKWEEEIYKEFTKHHPGNFAVVIEGNVGTGKSELCAYLSHQFRDDGRPVLHIDKNADLLSIMAEEIPQFYQEHIGGELPGASNVQRLQRHVRTNRETVASLVVAKAVLNISDLEDTDVFLDADQRGQLESFVKDKLTAISERGELATKVSFVDPGEIRTFDYLNVFDTKSPADAANAWNTAIWEAIREEYDSPSMDQLLERVGKAFGDNRPALVFEDFSLAALDAEKLGNYMEDDGTENNWDFIVAGTQDSTEILRTQTGVERHQFYRTNRPDSSSVLFLDEETCIEFIRPYLGYVKYLDESVSYERGDDNEIIRLERPAAGSRCDDCGFCSSAFRDLFPLSEPFLERIYLGLDDGDQRPRQYVQKVFDILEDYYNGIVDSPASSGELNDLMNPLTVHDSVYENEEVRRLAKWYGEDRVDDRVQVDYRFVEAFGLADVSRDSLGIETAETDELGSDNGTRTVWVIPTPETSGGGDGGSGRGGPRGGGDTKSPEEAKIDELRGHLDTWRNDPTSDAAADLDVYMRKGLKDAFDSLTNGFALQTDGSLEFFVGGNEEPFVLSEEEVAGSEQVMIDTTDFNPSDLLELLEFGVYREMSPRSANEADLLDAMGTQLTAYVREWRESIRSTYLESADNFFVVGAENNTFEDFILGVYGLATLLHNPWKAVTADRIAEAYFGPKLTIDDQLAATLDDRLHADEVEVIKSFMDRTESIESLLEDYFAASGNVLDRPRIRAHMDRNSPVSVVDDLKKGGLSSLPAKLRFGSNETLTNLGIDAYDAGNALSTVVGDDDAGKAARFVDHQLRDIDMEQASAYVRKIRTYDDVSPEVKEELARFGDYSQKDIDEVLTACSLSIDSRQRRDPHSAMQATLAGLKIWEHDLTGILAGIELSNGPGGSEMGEFLDLSEKYVNQ